MRKKEHNETANGEGVAGKKDVSVVYKKTSDLTAYAGNPRVIENAVPKVAESIRQFGFKVPLVIDKNNVVVCGHTRLEASKKLGLSRVPCIVADDLTDKQIKAFRVADNKVQESSFWDWSKLDIELAGLAGDFDMSDFGFDLTSPFDNIVENGYLTARDKDVPEDAPEETENAPAALPQSFAQKVYDTAGIFTLTFVFKEEDRPTITAALRDIGKEAMTRMLVDMLKGESECRE